VTTRLTTIKYRLDIVAILRV